MLKYVIGAWLSWLERTYGVREVAGSSPAAPMVFCEHRVNFVRNCLVNLKLLSPIVFCYNIMMKNVPLEVKLRISQQLETGTLEDRKASIRELARFPVVMQAEVVPYPEAPEESVWPRLSWGIEAEGALWQTQEERPVMIFTDTAPIATSFREGAESFLFFAALLDFAKGELILDGTEDLPTPDLVEAEEETDGTIDIHVPVALRQQPEAMQLGGQATLLDPFISSLVVEEQTVVPVDESGIPQLEFMEDLVAGGFLENIFSASSDLQIGHIAAGAELVRHFNESSELQVPHLLFTISEAALKQARDSLPISVLNVLEDSLVRQALLPLEVPGTLTGAKQNGELMGWLSIWNKYLLRFNHPTIHFFSGNFRPILGGILQFEPKEIEAQPRPKHLPGIPIFKVPYNLGVDCHVTSEEDLKEPCRNLDAVPKPLVQYFAAKENLDIEKGVWYAASGEFYDGTIGTVYFFVPEGFYTETEQILQDLGLLKHGASSEVSVHNLLYELSRIYFAKILSFASLNSASEAVSA